MFRELAFESVSRRINSLKGVGTTRARTIVGLADRAQQSRSLVYLPAMLAQVTRLKHGKKRREEKSS